MDMKSSISPDSEYRFYRGLVATCVANGIQAANFLGDRFLRKAHRISSEIDELYTDAMNSAFCATEAFLVTGAPHASAYYPRDFAWFYPDVLDPDTIINSEDAIRGFVCSKRTSGSCWNRRSGVVTTTIIPAAQIGISVSTTFRDLRIRCWVSSRRLEQIICADQRASASYLGLSQGAHAGRLLLIEYREDLKKAIIQLARSLEPFDDNGTGYLLCDAAAPRSAATDTRAERRRFVTNACIYATFLRAIELGVIRSASWSNCSGANCRDTRRNFSACSASMAISFIPWIAIANHLRLPSPWTSSMCGVFGTCETGANARCSQPRQT